MYMYNFLNKFMFVQQLEVSLDKSIFIVCSKKCIYSFITLTQNDTIPLELMLQMNYLKMETARSESDL